MRISDWSSDVCSSDLEQTPSPAIKDTLGWILLRKGNETRGLELIREAYEELSDNPEVLYHYAYAMYYSGEQAAAREALARLFENGTPDFDDVEDARTLWNWLQN